ncbi:MAG: DUF2322 family protein [Methylophilaceae bacterium]
MQTFKEILDTLEDTGHIKKIKLFNRLGDLTGILENKPGSYGSIKVYYYLYRTFGEINSDAAIEGLEIYSEHTEDAQNHPGKHPNIDRLFEVLDNEEILKIKIVK